MFSLANHIFYSLKRYEPVLQFIPKEDIMQEILFAILTAKPEHVFRVAHRLIYNLCSDYGFSRKKGKDNFEPFYNKPEFTNEEKELIESVEQMYIAQDMTAREVAQVLDIDYNNKFQKILCAAFPKQLGKGGKRKNAGNNKHFNNTIKNL